MIFEPPLLPCTFLRRYKRFLADVRLPDGSEITVHCPNSGSMRACQPPGVPAWITDSGNPKRKLPHTLEVIEVSPGVRCLVNTHRPNGIVEEALAAGVIPALSGYASLAREVRYGAESSRIDVLLSDPERGQCYVEVKNVTLGLGDGLAAFPDAVTARGTKHLRELMAMVAEGHRAVLLFCVGRTDITEVIPADDIDPTYGRALRAAAAAGVEIMAWGVSLDAQQVRLTHPVPVRLPPLG